MMTMAMTMAMTMVSSLSNACTEIVSHCLRRHSSRSHHPRCHAHCSNYRTNLYLFVDVSTFTKCFGRDIQTALIVRSLEPHCSHNHVARTCTHTHTLHSHTHACSGCCPQHRPLPEGQGPPPPTLASTGISTAEQQALELTLHTMMMQLTLAVLQASQENMKGSFSKMEALLATIRISKWLSGLVSLPPVRPLACRLVMQALSSSSSSSSREEHPVQATHIQEDWQQQQRQQAAAAGSAGSSTGGASSSPSSARTNTGRGLELTLAETQIELGRVSKVCAVRCEVPCITIKIA